MKKVIVLTFSLLTMLIFVACSEKTNVKFPFDTTNVTNIEMYHYNVPAEAEKKTLTEQSDIDAVFKLFEKLSLEKKKTETTAVGSVTSFRFNLSDGTNYELIYVSEAVKAGRLKSPSGNFDYFTSADIEGYWNNFDIDPVSVNEGELPSQSK